MALFALTDNPAEADMTDNARPATARNHALAIPRYAQVKEEAGV